MNELMSKRIYNYAKLIIARGLCVREKPVVIQGSTEVSYFIGILSETAYQAGASHVEVVFQDDVLERLKYEYESEETVGTIPPFAADNLMYYLNQGASYLRLTSQDPCNLDGLDTEKIKKGAAARNHALKKVQPLIMGHEIKWCIAAAPGRKWAETVFPEAEDPAEQLWDSLLKCCFCDEEDPIARWDDHVERMKQRLDKLNGMSLDRLHFSSGNGTDIVIGLCEGHRWRGGDSKTPDGIRFSPNIPTYELYSVPHKDRADGVAVSTKPLSYMGHVIEPGFALTYKNGEIVHVETKKREEGRLLETILHSYGGTERLGEVAIVDFHNPIGLTDRLFYNTLLDENAACHLAMGNGLGTAVDPLCNAGREGVNRSDIHIDYMIGSSDMACIGISKDGKEYRIMEEGKIII